MNTQKAQSIEHAIKENFKSYSDDYPTSVGDPSDDAVSALQKWVENEYANDDDTQKGEIKEWYEIAIAAYLDFFEFQSTREECYDFVKEQLDHIASH